MTAFLVLVMIPAVIVVLLLKNHIEMAFSSGIFLGFAFLFTALALFTVEFLSRGKAGGPLRAETRTVMTWFDALIIGLCQAVTVVSGVSRSGLTLSRRLDRDLTVRFSFLLSIPAILGALTLQIKDIAQGNAVENIGVLPIAAGTLTAALVGFSVKFILKIVRERSLRGFAVYVAILGILVLIDQFVTHLFF
jgi:undecaprenyl-diphosphatase